MDRSSLFGHCGPSLADALADHEVCADLEVIAGEAVFADVGVEEHHGYFGLLGRGIADGLVSDYDGDSCDELTLFSTKQVCVGCVLRAAGAGRDGAAGVPGPPL